MIDVEKVTKSTRFRSTEFQLFFLLFSFVRFQLPKAEEKWTLMEKLGEGTYGQVYRTKDRLSNEQFAAKIIRLPTDELLTELSKEFNVLKNISAQQENLPKFYGAFTDHDVYLVPRLWFVMELCQIGPMSRLLRKFVENELLNVEQHEKLIAYGMKSAVKALNYLHKSGIMHRGSFNRFSTSIWLSTCFSLLKRC